MLSRTSVCFTISKLILFIFFSCTMHYTFQRLFLHYFPFFLIDRCRKQVLLIKESSFFWSSKIFFRSFQLFENGHIHNVVSTSINVMNLDAENNNNVSALPNVNINIELDNVDFDVVNFNVDIHNLVSTLIWHCPTSHHHITLTTLRKRSKSFLGIEEYC